MLRSLLYLNDITLLRRIRLVDSILNEFLAQNKLNYFFKYAKKLLNNVNLIVLIHLPRVARLAIRDNYLVEDLPGMRSSSSSYNSYAIPFRLSAPRALPTVEYAWFLTLLSANRKIQLLRFY